MSGYAPTSAAAVANAFLDIQDADDSRYPQIDPMKLQKLLYYAHAWWLAIKDEPLFNEDIEAWPWGPVVRDIYIDFQDFGRDPIVGRRATMLTTIDDNDDLRVALREPKAPIDDVMGFLRDVWETHKNLTGVQLSNATHAVGEPWEIVKRQYGNLDSKPTIPNAIIRDVFRRKIERQQA